MKPIMLTSYPSISVLSGVVCARKMTGAKGGEKCGAILVLALDRDLKTHKSWPLGQGGQVSLWLR